jgi:hypothetical protein
MPSSFSIAAASHARADLFEQPGANERIDGLAKRFTRNVCRQVHSAIIASRSRGQNGALSIRKSWHRDPPLRWRGIVRRHHYSPASAIQPAGQDPEAHLVPGTVTLPLCSRTNASPFWMMLLLVWGRLDNWMIPATACGISSPALSKDTPLGAVQRNSQVLAAAIQVAEQ